MADLQAYVPTFVRRIPDLLTPTEWRYVGAATLGAAGLVVWAAVIRRARSRQVSEGDRSCDRAVYHQVLGAHKTPTTKIDRAWLYMPYVRAYAAHFGVDPTLLAGLIHTESGWNPSAGSSAGAVGLTQFVPFTAKAIFQQLVDEGQWPFEALTVNNDPQAGGKLRDVAQWLDRTNPQQAVWLGAKFLRNLLSKYGSPDTALAVYNAGMKAVGKHPSEWPAETRSYVPGVLRRQAWYQELDQACGRWT